MTHTHCCYCRRVFSDSIKQTIEHFIPKSKGGLNGENILMCCYDCNQFKKDRMPDEWLLLVERLRKKERYVMRYTKNDYCQIIGSLRHWINHFKGKNIGVYKF